MSTISHESPKAVQERRAWADRLLVREMWAALAIAAMWLAVLFTALFGPDIVNTSPGPDQSTVPSAVAVGLFAFLVTWVVARPGFGHRKDDAG